MRAQRLRITRKNRINNLSKNNGDKGNAGFEMRSCTSTIESRNAEAKIWLNISTKMPIRPKKLAKLLELANAFFFVVQFGIAEWRLKQLQLPSSTPP